MAQTEATLTMTAVSVPAEPPITLPPTCPAVEPQPAPPKANPSQSSKPHSKEDSRSPALVELNSQLYTRGLTRSGLKLESLNSKAQDQVIKVISKLLSQRAVRRITTRPYCDIDFQEG